MIHSSTNGDISVCNYTVDENRCPKLVRRCYWKSFIGMLCVQGQTGRLFLKESTLWVGRGKKKTKTLLVLNRISDPDSDFQSFQEVATLQYFISVLNLFTIIFIMKSTNELLNSWHSLA